MATTQLTTSNISLRSFFNYYGAPTSNMSTYDVMGYYGTAITYPYRGVPNLNFGYYGNTYLFYIQAVNTNNTKGSVSITYPFGQGPSGSSVGSGKQVVTSTYQYITIQVTVNYGYSFKGWYTSPSGGTLLSTSTTLNVYYTNPTSIWFAQYN